MIILYHYTAFYNLKNPESDAILSVGLKAGMNGTQKDWGVNAPPVVWLTTSPDPNLTLEVHHGDSTPASFREIARITVVIPSRDRRLVNWLKYLRKRFPEKAEAINDYYPTIRDIESNYVYFGDVPLSKIRKVECADPEMRRQAESDYIKNPTDSKWIFGWLPRQGQSNESNGKIFIPPGDDTSRQSVADGFRQLARIFETIKADEDFVLEFPHSSFNCGASSREKLDTFSDHLRQLARKVEQMQTDQEVDEFMRTMRKKAPKTESIIAALMAASAAGTISDTTTARAWTGAEFKAIADKASKAAKAYRVPGKR